MEGLAKLKLKCGIPLEDSTQDDLLNMFLDDAENAMKLFLNVEMLDSIFTSTKINLAKIYYTKDKAENVKSTSYSEGSVSESETYLTSADYDNEAELLLSTLKQYRRVYAKPKKKDSTEEV